MGPTSTRLSVCKDSRRRRRIATAYRHRSDGIRPSQNRDIGLSRNSKRVLAYAANESEYDLSNSIESDHLLRGILRNGDELATQMASIGYTLFEMREASEQAQISSGREKRSLLKSRTARYRSQLRTASLVAVVVFVFVIAILYLRSQN